MCIAASSHLTQGVRSWFGELQLIVGSSGIHGPAQRHFREEGLEAEKLKAFQERADGYSCTRRLIRCSCHPQKLPVERKAQKENIGVTFFN